MFSNEHAFLRVVLEEFQMFANIRKHFLKHKSCMLFFILQNYFPLGFGFCQISTSHVVVHTHNDNNKK